MNALSILTIVGTIAATIVALVLVAVAGLIGFILWSRARDLRHARPSETASGWE